MIRKFARPMLASVFVADGVDTLINQQDHQEGARELIARVRSVTPNQYNQFVPQNEKVLVQVVAGTKVAAGSLYALGKSPRLAAAALVAAQIPTMLARHAFWETQEPKEKQARRTGFLTDIGLLGGLFLATADTAGKPGLAWRAEKAGEKLNKQVQAALPTRSEAEKRTEQVTAALRDKGESLKESGAALGASLADGATVARERATEAATDAKAYVEDNKDSWFDQVSDAFDTAKSYVEDNFEAAKSYVDDNKDDWWDKANDLVEDATEYASGLASDLTKDAKKQRKIFGKRADKAAKKALKKVK
nr:DoxX family membrane protein [Corynebacterium lactis]